MTTHKFVFSTNAHHLFLQSGNISSTKLKNDYANNNNNNNNITLVINAVVGQIDLIS
jgi:hypothetical protein